MAAASDGPVSQLGAQLEALPNAAHQLACLVKVLLASGLSAPASQDVIDADECAALLRCNTETVEELARSGELPGLKFGRGWIFVRADLLLYLATKAREEAAERRSRRSAPAVVPQVSKGRRRAVPPALPMLSPD